MRSTLMLVIVLLMVCGCFVDKERQIAAQYVTDQACQASKQIAVAATAAGKMADAAVAGIKAAKDGDDAAIVATQARLFAEAEALAVNLQGAHESVVEAAQMSVVFQEDFGTPATSEQIGSPREADSLKVRYRSGIAARNAIMPVLTKLSPVPLHGGSAPDASAGGLLSSLGYGGTGLGIVATLLAILQRGKSLKTTAEAQQNVSEAAAENKRLKLVVDHAEEAISNFRDLAETGKPIDKPMFKRVLETNGPAMAAEHKIRQAQQIITDQLEARKC
jgi:hypothetical protein